MTVKRWGLRRRARRERGAVAVEAAIITPVLMLLVFGIIEFAFVMRDHVAVTSAVRVGGRMASAMPGAGPGGTNEEGDCEQPCSPANAPMFAQIAANAVQRAGSAMPKDSINELWVYKANTSGYPGDEANTGNVEGVDPFESCPSNCVRYKWVDSKNQFRYLGGAWVSSTVNACLTNTDAVGVYILSTHEYVTGLFGATLPVSDHAVMSFEPMSSVNCAAGQHS